MGDEEGAEEERNDTFVPFTGRGETGVCDGGCVGDEQKRKSTPTLQPAAGLLFMCRSCSAHCRRVRRSRLAAAIRVESFGHDLLLLQGS